MDLTWRAKAGLVRPSVRDAGVICLGPTGEWPVTHDVEYGTEILPLTGRPAFLEGPSRWTPEAISAAEWGLEVVSGTPRCTQAGLEVFVSLRPEGELRLAPTGVGTYAEWTIIAPAAGEGAWEDVNSYLPNDASYLRADAMVTAKISTFGVANTTTSPWYGLRWRGRFRSAPGCTTASTLHPVLRVSGRTYLGRELTVTAPTWVELAEDFWLNPSTGRPWASTELAAFEIGVVITSGQLECSWCVSDVGRLPERDHDIPTVICEFTTTGAANVARSTADQLVWVIDRYQVGKGGFQADDPAIVRPIEPTDDTLEQPVWTGSVTKSSFSGYKATYYCALPPDAFSDPVGEIMLLARVVSSTNPADIVGSRFPMAVAHFPAGFHTRRSIRVLGLTLHYRQVHIVIEEQARAGEAVIVVPPLPLFWGFGGFGPP